MRKMSIKLGLIAGVLAFGCLYQSPVKAQDSAKPEIGADGVEGERAEERQRYEEAMERERGR